MTNKRFFDRILQSRILWLIASIIASLILWTYVSSNEISDSTRTIAGVPVVFVGEEYLRGRNLVITNVDTTTVTLTLRGKQRALSKLNNTNISAQIDVSTITRSTDRKVGYQIVYPNEIDRNDITEIAYKSVENVGFFVDVLESGKFEVEIEFNGVIEDGYIEKSRSVDPGTITVTGAKEQLSTINKALVQINADVITKSIEDYFSFILLDANGDLIEYKTQNSESQDFTSLECESSEVFVQLVVQMIKAVELKVDIQEGGGATLANLQAPEYSVEYVTVAGDPEILEPLNSITVGSLNLASFASSYEETYAITYPNGIEMVSGETEVAVKFAITGLVSKTLSATSIEIINVPPGYDATLVTKSLEVTVRAPQSILSLVAANNIRVVVDLSSEDTANITTGNQRFPARVSIDGYPEAGIVYDYTVIALIEAETA